MRVAERNWRVTTAALAREILSSDLQFRRIVATDQERLIDVALTDGADLALDAAARWSSDPDLVAQSLNVPVIDSDAEGGYGSTVVYAEYAPKPLRIVLYRSMIARLDQRLVGTAAGETLGLTQTRPVFLAHELYHHLDLRRGHKSLARRERVTLLDLFGLRWTSGIASLAEIAAGAFAQRLLGLSFHPKLLDLIPADS